MKYISDPQVAESLGSQYLIVGVSSDLLLWSGPINAPPPSGAALSVYLPRNLGRAAIFRSVVCAQIISVLIYFGVWRRRRLNGSAQPSVTYVTSDLQRGRTSVTSWRGCRSA